MKQMQTVTAHFTYYFLIIIIDWLVVSVQPFLVLSAQEAFVIKKSLLVENSY